MLKTGLDTLITYNPFTVAADLPLAEVVQLLGHTGTRHWPVVDSQGALTGVVSAADIVRAMEACECDGASQSKLALTWLRVEAVMCRDADAVQHGDCPWDALELMLKKRRCMLPVIEDGVVIGTLSTYDFLRELSYGESPIARELVCDHCEKDYETLDYDQHYEAALEILCNTERRHAVVVRGDLPMGTVSRRKLSRVRCENLVRALFGESLRNPLLGELLKTCPTIAPGRTLGEAAGLMVEHSLDALAVANQAGHLLGLVTEDRILQAMLDYER